MAPKIAIVYYSLFGHIRALAEAEKRGIESAGGTADLYQLPEILPRKVLAKFNAPEPDPNIPIVKPEDLCGYDGLIFGVPTRYGSCPAQWALFWERADAQLQSMAYAGKLAGVFTSGTSLSSGMEMTPANLIPLFAQFGLIFMPLGARVQFAIGDVETVKGSSPWGAGTYVAANHTRFPTAVELEVAESQGRAMAEMFL